MTITLTTATRVGGAVVASGTTATYDPAIEADLVSRGMATYVSRQGVMDTGVPVMVVSNPLTGGVEISAWGEPLELGAGGGSSTLDGLTDTDVAAKADGNALVWDSELAKWVAGTVSTGDTAAISARVDALETVSATGLTLKGGWSAAAGTFPAGSVAGGYYIVTTAGTVNSVVFAKGDLLVALVNGASTSTYSANWLKLDESAVSPATSALDVRHQATFADKAYRENFSLFDLAGQTVTSGGTPTVIKAKVSNGLSMQLSGGGPFTFSTASRVGSGISRITHTATGTFTASNRVGFGAFNGTDRWNVTIQSNGWMIWTNSRGGGFYSTAMPAITTGSTVVTTCLIDASSGVMQIETSVNGGAPYCWRVGSVFSGAIELVQKDQCTWVHALTVETLGSAEIGMINATTARAVAGERGTIAAAVRMLQSMRRAEVGGISLPNEWAVYQSAGQYFSNVDLQPPLLLGDPMVTVYYVDIATGSDANPGTSALPLKSLYAAQSRVREDASAIIMAKGGLYPYDNTFKMGLYAGVFQVQSWDGNPIIASRHTAGLSWTADTGTTWSTTFAGAVSSVFDAKTLTSDGDYSRLSPAADLTACRATAGSYYITGTTIYVNALDGRQPDDDIRVYRTSSGTTDSYSLWQSRPGSTVYLEDVEFHGGTTPLLGSSSVTTNQLYLYCKRVGLKYAGLGGVSFRSDGVVAMQDCVAAYCVSDGFGYDPCDFGGTAPVVMEINCEARYNGWNATNTNNGSSSHGATIIRVGGDYHHNQDRSIHDIDAAGNSMRSWNLGVVARDSRNNSANFAVGISGGTDVGHMWLDGCTSSGSTGGVVSYAATTLHTYNLTSDSGTTGNVVAYVP